MVYRPRGGVEQLNKGPSSASASIYQGQRSHAPRKDPPPLSKSTAGQQRATELYFALQRGRVWCWLCTRITRMSAWYLVFSPCVAAAVFCFCFSTSLLNDSTGFESCLIILASGFSFKVAFSTSALYFASFSFSSVKRSTCDTTFPSRLWRFAARPSLLTIPVAPSSHTTCVCLVLRQPLSAISPATSARALALVAHLARKLHKVSRSLHRTPPLQALPVPPLRNVEESAVSGARKVDESAGQYVSRYGKPKQVGKGVQANSSRVDRGKSVRCGGGGDDDDGELTQRVSTIQNIVSLGPLS
jgi:hypothetical protein